MRIEVTALHTGRVGDENVSDANRGQLSPQSSKHLRPRHREQHVNTRSIRRAIAEPTQQAHVAIVDLDDLALTEGGIHQADTHDRTGDDSQHLAKVASPIAADNGGSIPIDFRGIEEKEVHVSRRENSSALSGIPSGHPAHCRLSALTCGPRLSQSAASE